MGVPRKPRKIRDLFQENVSAESTDPDTLPEMKMFGFPKRYGQTNGPTRRVVFHGYRWVYALLTVQLIGALAATANGDGNNEGSGSGGDDIEVEIKVPKEAEMGSSAELRCNWRLLGGNGLYSVKWYKDDHEFFRYVPDNDPRIQTFLQPGINQDKKLSNEKSIRLRNLSLASSGQYKCEVSTEAPSFATTYRTSNLSVFALPERGPEITGLSSHYAVGENVTANCTSWPSVPRAKLRWTINGEPVPVENTIRYADRADVDSPAVGESLGLRVEVEPRHLDGNVGATAIKIKCIAQVGSTAFAAEKEVPMAYVNNQRLSAGDTRGTGCKIRGNTFSPVFLLLIFFTT